MAQTYNIDIQRYNGSDWDTLLPTPKAHANTHEAGGDDEITVSTEMIAANAISNVFYVNFLDTDTWSTNSDGIFYIEKENGMVSDGDTIIFDCASNSNNWERNQEIIEEFSKLITVDISSGALTFYASEKFGTMTVQCLRIKR